MIARQFPQGQVEALVGQELKTLELVSPFRIKRLEGDELVLVISTGAERRIGMSAFRRAWACLARGDELERRDLDLFADRQGTYMAPILTKIPGIDFSYGPIRVYARRSPRVAPLDGPTSDVRAFLQAASAAGGCPFLDSAKKDLWATVVAGSMDVPTWEKLYELMDGIIDMYADSKLRAVPRRLKRDARACQP